MLDKILAITYRGSLKSCNYTCSYCPFGKKKCNIEDAERDKKDLEKFCEHLDSTRFFEPIDLLIAPYGEVLIYDYYLNFLAEMSKKPYIRKIGCQTNLSISPQIFIKHLSDKKADLKKIFLWASFHPEMIGIKQFVETVHEISSYINISAGVVGNPVNIKIISMLRTLLPPWIYLWVNKMDGLKRRYTKEEISFFQNIDPMFDWEMKVHKGLSCQGGKKHLFISANGDVFPCNRYSEKIGNLYKDGDIKSFDKCLGMKCDCYLAYSNLDRFSEASFLNSGINMRVPERLSAEALFLDVDGTILNKKGTVDEETKNALSYISKKIPVYLATELPLKEAMKKIKSLRKYFSGGCFAGGAHCVDFNLNYEEFTFLPELKFSDEEFLKNRIKKYTHDGKLYKVILPKYELMHQNHLSVCDAAEGRHNVRKCEKFKAVDAIPYDSGMVGLVSKGVNKRYGIEKICLKNMFNTKKIMCVGNSQHDINMIKDLGYSVAVPNSHDELKENADWILKVCQIAYIL